MRELGNSLSLSTIYAVGSSAGTSNDRGYVDVRVEEPRGLRRSLLPTRATLAGLCPA